MITTRMIEAFQAFVMTGSVTRAADSLYISQPAVSRLIRDLETSTKLNLFDRKRGRLVITNDGLTLYEEIQNTFIGLKHIEDTARRIRLGETGRLRVSCLPALSLSIIPEVMRTFVNANPNIEVSLQVLPSPAILRNMTTQQSDVGFVEASFTSPAVEEIAFFQVDCFCVLPPNHRLESREVIHPSDLADEIFISLDKGSHTRMLIDAVFKNAKVERKCQIDTTLASSAGGMVLEGIGISILDEITAKKYEAQGVIVKQFHPLVHFFFRTLFSRNSQKLKLERQFHHAFMQALPETVKVIKEIL